MKEIAHPDSTLLSAYLHHPEATAHLSIALHLASCVECREALGLMTLLKAQLSERRGQVRIKDQDEKDAQIARYLNEALPDEEKVQIETMMREEPAMLKAALFQSTQQSAMARALPVLSHANETKIEPVQEKSNVLMDRIKQCFRLKMPVWTTVPMTVVLATFALFLLMPQLDGSVSELSPTHYQDNQVIQFQPQAQPPGMGFFNKAQKSTQSYGKIKASFVKEGQLVLSWPSVEKAESYTMQLQMFKAGQKVTLGSVNTQLTQAAFNGLTQQAGIRYTWRLTGTRSDALVFLTSGGFVFDEK